MDYLTTKMIETYHQLIKEKTKKISNIIGIIAIVCLIISIVLFFIYNYNDQLILVVSIVFASSFVILGIIWLIVKYLFISEKPLYTYLYPKLLDDIQYNEKYILRYESYPKIKEVLIASKLFTRHASNITRCGFYYNNEDSYSISIYDTYYYTQSNNSVIVYFNGYYVVIEGIQVTPIQIRTKGSPSRSDVSFTKTVNEKQLKVYCEKPEAESNEHMMRVYEVLNKELQPKNLFISAVDQKLYIAIDVSKPKRKIKTLDKQSYAQLKSKLLHLIETIDEALSYRP